MSETSTSEDFENQAAQLMYANIMSQLLESARFQNFFHANFDLHKRIDADTKTISYLLVEVPPAVAQHRITDMVALQESAESPDIVVPSASEIKKISKT